ncbi:MAG: pseudouridine synthase [Pseudomonadota bacterium]
MTIPLLFEHPDFVIAHKSAGQLVHGDEDSLIYALQQQLEHLSPLDPVHRLDKDTSGVIVLSKVKSATAQLSILFQKRKVEKRYLAISDNKPKKKQGKIIGDMEKSRNGSYKLMRSTFSPAITHFSSVALSHGSQSRRLFFLAPKTGKTHQLRVALKALSSPIIGDKRYGGVQADRMYLHAYSIRFSYKNSEINVTSPILDGEYWPPLSFINDELTKQRNI